MTSTQFNVGLTEGTRLSSRVLRPPGGGHTDIFGGEPEAPRGRRGVPSAAAAASSMGQINDPLPTNGTEAPSQNGQESHEAPQPAPEIAQEAKPESPKAEVVKAESPKTESPKIESPKIESPKSESPKSESPKSEAPKSDPPKRVRVPPGGFSSGLW